MNTGTVNINDVIMGAFQFPVPFGGWNESGLGSRSGGAAGIRKYCRTKSIVAERVAMRNPLWYPYGPKKGKLLGRPVLSLAFSGADTGKAAELAKQVLRGRGGDGAGSAGSYKRTGS